MKTNDCQCIIGILNNLFERGYWIIYLKGDFEFFSAICMYFIRAAVEVVPAMSSLLVQKPDNIYFWYKMNQTNNFVSLSPNVMWYSLDSVPMSSKMWYRLDFFIVDFRRILSIFVDFCRIYVAFCRVLSSFVEFCRTLVLGGAYKCIPTERKVVSNWRVTFSSGWDWGSFTQGFNFPLKILPPPPFSFFPP